MDHHHGRGPCPVVDHEARVDGRRHTGHGGHFLARGWEGGLRDGVVFGHEVELHHIVLGRLNGVGRVYETGGAADGNLMARELVMRSCGGKGDEEKMGLTVCVAAGG